MFLKKAIIRHFEETRIILEQLTDETKLNEKIQTGRSLGEIILHMIRSLEFYLQGLSRNIWKPLPYSMDEYDSSKKIINLYYDVVEKSAQYLEMIEPESMNDTISKFNRTATKGEILLEILEHSIQHRGQLLVYYRLIGIIPEKIDYII